MLYIISYDLRQPRRDYQTLYDELYRLQAQRVLESLWVVRRSNTSAVNLRDHLKEFIDADDRVLVAQFDNRWATFNALYDINKI